MLVRALSQRPKQWLQVSNDNPDNKQNLDIVNPLLGTAWPTKFTPWIDRDNNANKAWFSIAANTNFDVWKLLPAISGNNPYANLEHCILKITGITKSKLTELSQEACAAVLGSQPSKKHASIEDERNVAHTMVRLVEKQMAVPWKSEAHLWLLGAYGILTPKRVALWKKAEGKKRKKEQQNKEDSDSGTSTNSNASKSTFSTKKSGKSSVPSTKKSTKSSTSSKRSRAEDDNDNDDDDDEDEDARPNRARGKMPKSSTSISTSTSTSTSKTKSKQVTFRPRASVSDESSTPIIQTPQSLLVHQPNTQMPRSLLVHRNIVIRAQPSSNLESVPAYAVVGVGAIVDVDVLWQDHNDIRCEHLCFNKFAEILKGVHKEYEIGTKHLVYDVPIFSWHTGLPQCKEIVNEAGFREAVGILELHTSGSMEPLVMRIIGGYQY
jgi:hypothetical protein